MSDDEKEVAFIPFSALNDFMRDDYRREVVRRTVMVTKDLPRALGGPIDSQIRKLVKVPGFRNSAKAPAAVKVGPAIEAFEKHPKLVGAILAGWAETHDALRNDVFALLESRQWTLLPVEANRAKLPGFLTTWPTGENFEVLQSAYTEMYPQSDANSDDVSLMVVWLGGRLPVDVDGEEEAEQG
jgi:hypothetical protein